MPDDRVEATADEIRRRVLCLRELKDDRRAHEVICDYLATDPVTFFNDWVWTYDPRNTGEIPRRLPMRLWPRQEELVRWIHEGYTTRQHSLVKKGRDVGATWIFAGYAAWLFLFHPDTSITFGSRKLELVDRLGDLDAIFPKLRMVLDWLPWWMLPPTYSRRHHDNFTRIINPDNGSTITGEGGDEAGRGGRSSLYIYDEFAFASGAASIKAAIMDNTDCVFELSTSNGIGTQFYRDEHSGAMRVFRINYRDDPRRQPWEEFRAKKIAETDPVTFAREHEMDDASAVERVVIPGVWVQSAVGYELEPRGVRQAGFDVATTGSAENVYAYRHGPVCTRVKAWKGADTAQSSDTALRSIIDDGGGHLAFDVVGVGAGVDGELHRRRRDLEPGQVLGCTFSGINGASSPTEAYYDDAPELRADERFLNLRAELWWALRTRFKKAFEHRTGVRSWPLDEQISIPNDGTLIAQLSSVVWIPMGSGKVKIESKDEMRKRGIASPDRADALVYAYADVARPADWW